MEQSSETSFFTTNVEQQQKSEDVNKLFAAANEAFELKNFDKCIKILDQLLENKAGNTAQIRHNRAISEFYKSQCVEHRKVLDSLRAIYDEQIKHKKGPSPILRYNLAVIHFHKHMLHTAAEILTPLIDKLDGENDSLKVPSSILMLRIMFALNQRKKALAYVNMVLSKYFPDESKTITDNSLEVRINDEIQSETENDSCKFKLFVLITNVLNRRIVAVPEDGSPEYAALKAHQQYIMKDFQMAAKQLQRIVQDPGSAENYELNTCIANNMGVIHMRVRHYAIAASFFQRAILFDKHVSNSINNISLQTISKAHTCEILYNLGITMLYLRRPQNAFQCFLIPIKIYHSNPRLWFRMAEACIMDYNMKRQEEDKKPLFQVIFDPEICQKRFILKPKERKFYNTSLSSAVPEMNMEFAALCLRNALRLAKHYKQYLFVPQTDGDMAENLKESEILQQSSLQQPIISTVPQPSEPVTLTHLLKESSQEQNQTSTWKNNDQTKSPTDAKDWKEVHDNNFCCPSKPVSKAAFDQLFCSIYAAYSYTALRNGDYIIALEMAQDLLKSDGLSDAHRVLGHMYAGEALLMMQKYQEAQIKLDPSLVTSLNAFDFETKDWEIKSVDICQSIWRYNIAIAYAMQGEYDIARTFINTVNEPLVNNSVIALRIYLQMKTRKNPIPAIGGLMHSQPQQQQMQTQAIHHGMLVNSGPTPGPNSILGLHNVHTAHVPSHPALPIHSVHPSHATTTLSSHPPHM